MASWSGEYQGGDQGIQPHDGMVPGLAGQKSCSSGFRRYLSTTSLPEAVSIEDGEEEEQEEEDGQGHRVEVDGPAPALGNSKATRIPIRRLPALDKRGHGAPVTYVCEPPSCP